MRSLNYFAKLTIFGCLLSTIPVIFIGIFAYLTSSQAIQENANEGKIKLIMQINSNVEHILTTVNHTMNQVLGSTVVKQALGQSLSANEFKLYNDLRNEIRHMQSFDTKLEDVIFINERYNWLVKNSGLYTLEEYEYAQELMQLMNTPHNSSWVLTPSYLFYSEGFARTTSGCPYNITLVKPFPANSLDTYGLALANIPTCSLTEMITMNQQDDSNTTVTIIDEHMRLLVHPDSTLLGEPVSSIGISLEEMTEQRGQYDVTVNGEAYAISYYRSPLTGWTYMGISSIKALTAESKKIGLYTIYICLILILGCFLIVWLGSKQFYTPIRRLLLQISGSSSEATLDKIKSNEFQLISERVHDLFQSKSELEHQLQQQLHQVRTLFFIKAYQGQIKSSEFHSQLQQYGFHKQLESWNTLATLTIQIDYNHNTRHTKQDSDLLLFAVHNVVEELIETEQRLTPIILDQSVVVTIGSPETNEDKFYSFQYSLTETLQKKIYDILHLQISIGISQPAHLFQSMSTAYREGLDALKHRIILGEGIIIRYDQTNVTSHALLLNYPQQLENELLDNIKLADEQQAKHLLSQILLNIFQTNRSPQEFQFPLTRLLNNLVHMMQESGIMLNQLHLRSASLLEQLLKISHRQEIEHWFWKTIIAPLIDIYRDRQEEQYHKLSEKIIDLIQQYYDTDLTLEECAAKLHYNANYLSGVFRKETNVSFSEYLTMYRFKMAKKWLSESNLPIKDIAARLKYNNSQNFIRSFRKQEGMTPGQYREKYRTKDKVAFE